jgi:hypothetical protein
MKKTNNFLEKCNNVHGSVYDYSLVDYVNNKTKVKIICSIHGEFEQTPDKHINSKQGCPKCSANYKLTKEDFIKLSNKVHNNKYNYSNSIYLNANSEIDITCLKHGKFKQRASAHMSGHGCPKCVGKNKTNEEVIDDFISVHGNKYDYSLVNYVNQKTSLKIICKKHGVFEQTYDTHKKGHGCPNCVGRNKTTQEFIEQAKKTHGNKYDYSLVEYEKSNDKIKIICPIHGKFEQKANNHLNGNGCPKCKGLSITEKKTKTTEQFISEAKLIHGDKYGYSLVDYKNGKEFIKILCEEHGEFEQTPEIHLTGCGCQKCGFKYNHNEVLLTNFIQTLNIKTINNSRKIISPLELDVFIPSHNIAIEYNGLYWHSELLKPSNYHLNKTELCEKQGIKLIHIFEDEWLFKQEIVKSRLKNILGLTENKIYARKCMIKEISSKESKQFLIKNHIQGNVNSSIKLGLYYNDELVSIMTFGKGRIALGGKSNQYELLRFCNKLDTIVIGGADKLLKYFIKNYQPKEIISYADRRWSKGDLYEKLGFEKKHNSQPNYWYIINNRREYRFGYRKSILVKKGFDQNKTEHKIMLDRGIYRIYDCGNIAYKKTLY